MRRPSGAISGATSRSGPLVSCRGAPPAVDTAQMSWADAPPKTPPGAAPRNDVNANHVPSGATDEGKSISPGLRTGGAIGMRRAGPPGRGPKTVSPPRGGGEHNPLPPAPPPGGAAPPRPRGGPRAGGGAGPAGAPLP